MTAYDKRRIFRLYGDGKSYVITSQLNDEKLQIKLVDSAVCLNKLNSEEWQSMLSKTNSVRSAAYSLMLESYGCLGLMSTSMLPTQTNDDHSSGMQHCLLFVKDAISVGSIRKFDIMKITDVFLLPMFSDINSNVYAQQSNSSNSNLNYYNDLRKFLSSGVFYFAHSADASITFDLTLSSQARNLSHLTNKKFLWNYNLHIPFRRLGVDTNQWLLKIICGCVEIKKVFTLSKSFKACLFSRLSCERVGTRFQCRGLNDEGHCANFVESEQVLFSEDSDEESSFLQVRGSVPVFFEQTGLQVGNHRIKVSRGPEACYPAFDKHIKSLIHEYGTQLYILNLLGTKGDESFLTDFFYSLCNDSPLSMNRQLAYSNFDYHLEMKLNKQSLGDKMWPQLISNLYSDNHKLKTTDGMFFYFKKDTNVNKLQTKFIRTNCMDCLDRTNNVQSYIGIEMLTYQLKDFLNDSETNKLREVRELFRQMWIINGDYISKIYAGTGAIQGKSVTQDISRSLTRAIQNNFLDSNKQDAIETFLFSMSRNYGDLADRVKILMSQNSLRLPYPVLRHMVSQYRHYTEQVKCRISISTWNINGGLSPGDMERLDLKDWLIDGPLNARKNGLGYIDPNANFNSDTDIFVIGFEEIVDLNAQNIVKSSDEHALIWLKKLNTFLQSYGQYVPLIIDPLQLVGVCIFVFVLQKHVQHIRDVCVSKSKTGLGGNAGNKGGVLVRFVYYNTSMCFVCSHFAAHQKEVKQRNDDFRQIYENSEFVGQSVTGTSTRLEVKMHDYVFWCGDLNYRIDLQNDRCRSLIGERDWNTLLEQDQLTVQKKCQFVFKEFNEAPVTFPPTYKYNLFEDSYDRSEKCRVPAWTDRILWRRRLLTRKEIESKNSDIGKCLYYGRADIRYSDHRPVSALLEVEVNKVIPKKLIEVLNRQLLDLHGPFQIILIINTHTNQMNDTIKNEIVELFQKYRSFAMSRQFKNNLYITYTDGRFAYEAFAQLNNHHLESCDLILQVRVDNEQNFSKLIEQEVMDCLMSINMRSENNGVSRLNEAPLISTPSEVLVGDLLGDSFSENHETQGNSNFYMNVPTQLHSNLSITNSLHTLNTNRIEALSEDDSRHQYHNPMIKALSNSNLNMFDQPMNSDIISITQPFQHLPKIAHSAANLLDTTNDDIPGHVSLIAPPRRPPPPSGGVQTINLFQNSFQQVDTKNFDTIPKSNSFGFEDDFGSIPANKLATSNNAFPVRPPPLPPFPINQVITVNEPQQTPENEKKPSFSLFDDSFEPFASISQPQVTIATTRPPPLPPMPSTKASSIPPPLPPLPPRNSNNLSSNRNLDLFELADLDLSSSYNQNNVVKNNNSNQNMLDFDALNNSNLNTNKPLPPPRPNHFK